MNDHLATPATIEHLHATFCDMTGVRLRLGLGEYHRSYAWTQFIAAKFTLADLVLVLRYLQREIKAGHRNPGALRFSNLIERLELFEETLSMARAALRVKQPTAKDRVLRQYERQVGESALTPMTAKSMSEWMKGMEILKRAAQ